MQLASRCDTVSWEAVIGRYHAVIRSTVATVITDPADLADCVQDILLRLPAAVTRFRVLPGTRSIEAMETLWLQRLALNAAINRAIGKGRRQKRLRPLPAAHDAMTTGAAADDLDERRSLHHALHESLAGLREAQRDVIIMHYFQGLDHATIAAHLRCSPGACRVRLHRALETVRGILAGRGYALGSVALIGVLGGMGETLQAATSLASTPAAIAASQTLAPSIALPLPTGGKIALATAWGKGITALLVGVCCAGGVVLIPWTPARTAPPITASPIAPSMPGTYAGKRASLMTPWASLVSPQNALTEYPRPQLVRTRWLNLNGLWEFTRASEADAVPTGRTLAERILVPFPVESALSGLMRAEERMWYRRTFAVPEEWAGQRVRLNFGAVDWQATVYVNGQRIGRHRGGYTAFGFDITDALKPGDNELIVNAYDPTDAGNQPVGLQTRRERDFFFTSSSGIWQTVWLEPVPMTHIARLVMIPDAQRGTLRITVEGDDLAGLQVSATASAAGRPLAETTGPAAGALELAIPQPRRWSPEDPYLYDLQVTLRDGKTPVDSVASYFGLRSVAVGRIDGKARPLLNGSFVFHLGTLDRGWWPDGISTAPTDDALRFDLAQQKRFGFNAVRKCLKVEPARWYYWADRLGLLVWQDLPCISPKPIAKGGSWNERALTADEVHQAMDEYREIVDQLVDSPAVVGYIDQNLAWGGMRTDDIRRLATDLKARDPSRFVSENSGGDSTLGDVADWQSLLDPGSPPPSATRFAAVGNFGRTYLTIPGHNGRRDRPVADPLGIAALGRFTERLRAVRRYRDRLDILTDLMHNPGLSAAFYNQFTDVEADQSGLLTYDRRVLKAEPGLLREAHDRLLEASRSLPAMRMTSFIDTSDATWSTLGGTWMRTGNGHTLGGSAPGSALADTCFGNAVHDADIRLAAGGTGGLLFHASRGADGLPDGYALTLSAAGSATLSHVAAGVWTPLRSAICPTAGRAVHHLRIETLDATIAVFVDDLTAPLLTATDRRAMTGAIGVLAAGAGTVISAIAVDDPFVRLNPVRTMKFIIHDPTHQDVCLRQNAANQMAGTQWRLVPGLADPQACSIASCDLIGAYLVDVDGVIYARPDDGSTDFRRRATWKRVPGLLDPALASFESYIRPGEYMRHGTDWLMRSPCGNELARQAATFALVR